MKRAQLFTIKRLDQLTVLGWHVPTAAEISCTAARRRPACRSVAASWWTPCSWSRLNSDGDCRWVVRRRWPRLSSASGVWLFPSAERRVGDTATPALREQTTHVSDSLARFTTSLCCLVRNSLVTHVSQTVYVLYCRTCRRYIIKQHIRETVAATFTFATTSANLIWTDLHSSFTALQPFSNRQLPHQFVEAWNLWFNVM